MASRQIELNIQRDRDVGYVRLAATAAAAHIDRYLASRFTSGTRIRHSYFLVNFRLSPSSFRNSALNCSILARISSYFLSHPQSRMRGDYIV